MFDDPWRHRFHGGGDYPYGNVYLLSFLISGKALVGPGLNAGGASQNRFVGVVIARVDGRKHHGVYLIHLSFGVYRHPVDCVKMAIHVQDHAEKVVLGVTYVETGVVVEIVVAVVFSDGHLFSIALS